MPSEDWQQLAVFLKALFLSITSNITWCPQISTGKKNNLKTMTQLRKHNLAGGRTEIHTHLGKCLQTNHCRSFCPAGICSPLEAPWFSRAEKRSTESTASEQKQEVNHVRPQKSPPYFTQRLGTVFSLKILHFPHGFYPLSCLLDIQGQCEIEVLQEHDPFFKHVFHVPIMGM